ncbi:MAG: thiamine diphosphokinase [Euryarchaeota archaeon]|nr:thiamine diphosphokinase [Euryarchaeota archaeon]
MAATKNSALLIAAGEVPINVLKNILSDEKLNIAIDGGYLHCLKYDITPDIVIGDFDSLDSALLADKNIQIFDESQQETDLVKAINWAISSKITNLDIIGVESGRSDHILGTFAALAELKQELTNLIDIKLHLYDFVVRYVPKQKSIKLKLEENTHLSLFCLSKSTISFKGVKWSLEEEEMYFSTQGIHNYSISNHVELFVHDGGPVLLFIKR